MKDLTEISGLTFGRLVSCDRHAAASTDLQCRLMLVLELAGDWVI